MRALELARIGFEFGVLLWICAQIFNVAALRCAVALDLAQVGFRSGAVALELDLHVELARWRVMLDLADLERLLDLLLFADLECKACARICAA